MNVAGWQIAVLLLSIQFGAIVAVKQPDVAQIFEGWPLATHEQIFATVTIAISILAVPALRTEARRLLSVPIRSGTWHHIGIVALLAPCVPFSLVAVQLILVALGIGTPSAPSPDFDALARSRWAWSTSFPGVFHTLVFSCFLIPFVEELNFRGFLLAAWERRWRWWHAMLLTSATFGLFHNNYFLGASLIAVLITCLYRITGSLRSCLIVHGTTNLLVSWPLLGHLRSSLVLTMDSAGSRAIAFATLLVVLVGLTAYLRLALRASTATAPSSQA